MVKIRDLGRSTVLGMGADVLQEFRIIYCILE